MRKLAVVKSHYLRAAALVGLWGVLAAAGCKDDAPCDPGQESIGTGCFPVATGGGAGGPSVVLSGGAADEGGAGGAAPGGNPDATFGTPCQSDVECGGDAPICATDPLFYCTQLQCKDGQENAGACPEGWTCLLLPPNPSACVNLASVP